ncbi:lysylphosphatidylglycerol synthase transmembrane domain-containing protein, partial [Streptomyces sp. NPDC058726]|uniref:lysylphosphatidylglycerol synthase transmembrane domain-containing protein n=1 Tax=Streptomyces sp. NPDC058726 TaxID=3346611 RepID=UPI0036B96C9F
MSGRGRGRLSALAAWLNTRTVRTRLCTLAGVVILGVLFWRLGTGALVDGVRRIDGATLAAALGIGLVTTAFSAWRWALVARGIGIRLPLRAAVADYYRALFLNAALPGGVLGDVHRAVRHGKEAGDLGRGVRAVVLERTAGQLALFVAGGVVLATVPSPVLGPVRQVAPVVGLGVVGVCAVGLALRMNRGAAARPARGPGPGWGARILGEAREGLCTRRSAPGVLVSSVVVLGGYVAMFVLAARVAGVDAGVWRLLPLAVLALLAMGLPLNVGGWGPREGVTAWAFGAAGLGAGVGFTVAVVYGVLSLVASLPGVVVLVVRWYGGVRSVGGRVSVVPAAPSLPVPGGGAPGPPAGLRPRPQTPDGLGVGAPPLPQAPDGLGVGARACS